MIGKSVAFTTSLDSARVKKLWNFFFKLSHLLHEYTVYFIMLLHNLAPLPQRNLHPLDDPFDSIFRV